MKKIIGSFFVVLLALSAATCVDKDNSNDKEELEEAKTNYYMEAILNRRSNEFVSLLSIKYDLNADLTHKIINEFIRDVSLQDFSALFKARTMEEFERLKAEVSQPSVEERIKKISAESNVEESRIASLVIDYKTWFEARHD